MSAIYIVDEFVKHAPSLAIGRSISMESVGFFSRAAGSIDLFGRGIGSAATRIALPYFAAQRRSGSGLKEGYLRQVSYLTGVGWSFCCVLGVLAFPVVRTLYGGQWDQVVPLLQLLCVVFAIDLAAVNAPEALIAMGLIRKATRLALVTGAVRVGCVLATVTFGLQAVCIGLIVASIVNFVLTPLCMRGALGLSFAELVRGVRHSAVIAALTALAIAGASVLFGRPQTQILEFLLGASVAILAWLTALIAFKHPLGVELTAVAHSLKNLVPKRSS